MAESFPIAPQSASTAVALSNAPIRGGTSQPPLKGQAKIDQMAADAQDNVDAAASALSGFAAQMQNVVGNMQKSATEAAQAKEAAVITAGNAEVQAQKATLDQANALGTNPQAASFILNKVAEEYAQNNKRAQGFADDINYALNPSNITKDPLKYIGSLLMYDLNKEGQASAERAASRSYQQYQGLNDMTQNFGKTQAAIAQTVTTESVLQNAKVAAFALNQQASQAQLQGLQLNSENLMRALKLQNEPFDIERMRQASQNDAERLAMARQQAAKQNIEMDLRLAAARRAEAREQRQDAKFKEAEQIEADMLQIVNTAAAATGIPIKFNSVKELTMARMSPEFKEKIDTLYHIGLQTAYSTRVEPNGAVTPTLAISDSPTKTLSFVKGMGAKLSPGQQPIVDLIDSTRNSLLDTKQLMPNMKPGEYQVTLDKGVMEEAIKQYRNISKGTDNIYAPPPLTAYLGNPEFAAGAPSIAAEMKLQADLGVKGVDFQKLTTALTKAAKEGKVQLKQIDSELKFFAEKTMAMNNALRRYDETAGLPRMKNMNVSMAVPAGKWAGRGDTFDIFGGSDEMVNVDLADDNKRQAYLNKLYARNIPDVLKQQAAQTGAQK